MKETVAQEEGKILSKVIRVDENEVKKHLGELVRGTVCHRPPENAQAVATQNA